MSGVSRSEHEDLTHLRARLADAEALVRAIQHAEVDAVVVHTPQGDAIYTLTGADRPYRAFLDAMRDGAFTADSAGTILYANHAFARLVDAPLELVLGSRLQRFLGEAAEPETLATADDCELTTASGRRVPVHVSATPMNVDGVTLVAGIVRDLSEERLTARLRESEERLRLAAEATGFGVYDVDPRANRAVWSVQLKRMVGLSDDAPESQELLLQRLHPDDRERVFEDKRRAALAERSTRHEMEFRIVRDDGEVRWLHDTAHLFVADEQGRPRLVRILGTVHDITDRKRADEALHASELRRGFLLTLSDALRPLADPPAIQREACRLLAEFLGAGHATYVEIDEPAGPVRVERDGVQAEASSLDREPRVTDVAWSLAILRRGECPVIADTQTSPVVPPGDRPAAAALQIIACCGAPLVKDGRVVGALVVTDARVRTWSEQDGALVREVGERIWSAIEAARAQDALRARHRQLDLLARMSQRLLTAAEVDADLVGSIGGDIASLIDMDAFYHYRPADEPRLLRLAAHGGVSPEEQRLFATMRVGEFPCGRVAETQQRLIVEDLQHARHPGSEILRAAGATSYAGFPLVTNGVLFGTLAFVSRRRTHLREGDVQTIQSVCDQIAIAYERTRLERERRVSEERARLALDGGDLGAWDVDIATGTSVWSRRHAGFQGLDPDATHSLDGWQALVHPDDLDEVAATMARARLDRTAFAVEHRLRRADTGEERWLALYGRYVYDDSGAAVRVSGVSRDVTERRRAERALRQAELRFKAFIEAAPHLVWECDPRGRCVYQGPQWQECTGQSPEASHGDGWLEMVHPDDRSQATDAWAAAQGGDLYSAEYRLRTRSGAYRWMLARARAVRDTDGAVKGWCGTSTDIHELRQARAAVEEREQRFRAMADQTPMIMWITDAEGGIEFVNQAYCVFFGVTLEQVRGPHWQPLLHPDDGAYVSAFRDALTTRRPFHGSARVRRADGEWRWIASIAHPRFAPDGTLVGMIGVSPDVTDQRRALEREHEAARQKDEFIAVLAHELRNPLAPIRTSVGVLRASGAAEPALSTCRDVIDRQVAHMARLLDDLLDVSRLSRGTLTLQRTPVRLRDVVAHASETVRPIIDDRGHTLVIDPIDPALVLEADPARLSQVLTNLLNNAAKYTNPGGTVTVTTDAHDGQVVIRVRDTGIGLRADMRERIFELFTQIEDARHRADGGLGIGLGLTKRLVDMHGGTIAAESQGPGHGSTFTVTLPLQDGLHLDDERADSAPDQAGGQTALRRVLIVDDNADAADTLALLLGTMGCETRTVYDGAAALREAATFHPDLILLDLGMPGLDGSTVCTRLRQETWGATVVIAAVTGWGQEEDRRSTRSSGFDVHLVKPVDPQHLMRLVRELPADRLM